MPYPGSRPGPDPLTGGRVVGARAPDDGGAAGPAGGAPSGEAAALVLELPYSGLTVRMVRGTGGRPALGVSRAGELLAVSVASRLGSTVLGALRGGSEGAHWAVSWGRLGPGGDVPRVGFGTGRRGRPAAGARVVVLAGHFWVAEAPGRFRVVVVAAWPGRAPETYRLVGVR